MQIGRLSLERPTTINKTSTQKRNISNQLASNPFGVSFKGNVIQADVFASEKKVAEQTTNKIAEKGKVFASAVVSGINNFNTAFKSRINSVISFGKKTTTDMLNTIERIGNTEVTINMEGIKNRLFPDRQYSVKNLSNRPVNELKDLWQSLTPQEA